MKFEIDTDDIVTQTLQEDYRSLRKNIHNLMAMKKHRPLEQYETMDLLNYHETLQGVKVVLEYYMCSHDATRFFKEVDNAFKWYDYDPGNSDDDWNSGIPGGC